MSGGLLRQAGRRPRAHLLVPGFRKALTGRVGVGRNGQCAPPACQARSQAPPGPLKGADRSRYHATSRHSERCAVPGVGLSAVPASRNVPDFSLYKNRRRIAATCGMLTDCDALCTFCAKLERSLMFARSARGKPRRPSMSESVQAVWTDAPLLLVTAHRRESWGERMRDIASAVAELARKHPDLIVVLPLHPNPVVREALLPALHGLDNVMLVEPMGYGAFARLLQRSTVVLTDSGGVQEEAPSLGKPVLVMRDTTERPEAVSAGTARLVGTDPDRVYSAVNQLLTCPRAYKTMANAVNPYGDGAAQRTAEAIKHMFDLGNRPVPFGGSTTTGE